MNNEMVEKFIFQEMCSFDAIEGKVEENLAECGVGWEALLNFPISPIARAMSDAGH